jgi:DNA-binding NarL/FixJ family response regulator
MGGPAAPVPAPTCRVLVTGDRRLLAEAVAAMLGAVDGVTALAVPSTALAAEAQVGPPNAVVVTVTDNVTRGREVADTAASDVPEAKVIALVPPPTRLWATAGTGSRWSTVSLDDDAAALLWAVGATVVAPPPRRPPKGGGAELSAREIEILRSLADGARPTAISSALGLSPHTVRSHIRNLTTKLGAKTQLEAVAAGREAGYLPMPSHRPRRDLP